MYKNVSLVSLGCAKNLIDSEVMMAKLKNKGYNIYAIENEAEIIIVNTCCFIDSAKAESIETILELAQYKKEGNLKLLIVAGCMGERFKDEVLQELPEVDAVIGTGDFQNICEIIEKAQEKRACYIKGADNAPLDIDERILATPPYTAYVKIAEGCSNHCTYCVIPSIRGKYRSRNPDNILSEVKTLAKNGVKEIILIAQDTSCYGVDLPFDYKLNNLINDVSGVDGIKWIRLHYLYPEEITDELINEIVQNDKVVKYFDIPIQHASNKILKHMGRKTTKENIVNLINKIRDKIPDAVFRTSLIVGFPGETDEDFFELIDFLKEMKLQRVGVFPYSQEEGTPAAKFKNQLDNELKDQRVTKIREVQYEIENEFSTSFIGKNILVLTEGYDKMLKMYFGRSSTDSIDVDPKVFFKSDSEILSGQFVEIKVTDSIDCDLIGEYKEDNK